MEPDAFMQKAVSELRDTHGAHTILLYGSRADGTYGEDSDYDLAAFSATQTTLRIARRDDGRYLDAFIYPQATLENPTPDYLALRGSKILLQQHGSGDRLLAVLEDLYQRGPVRKTDNEIEVLKVWAHKMLARIERGDAEGNYRRSWLLTALLEDYFDIHGLWWQGPKKGLRWLQKNDPETYSCFVLALMPDAQRKAIVGLVERVTGRSQNP